MKSKIISKTFYFSTLIIVTFFCMCDNPMNDNISFRANNSNTGFYQTSKINKPIKKWKTKINGNVFSSPSIAGNFVYIGSGDNNLYALSTENGEIKWTFESKGAIHSTPAINNNTIYFTSKDGKFYAVYADNGTEKWNFNTEGEKQYSAINLFGYDTDSIEVADPWDLYLSSPVVTDNIVYFGSGDSHIYALDANSGSLVWKFKTGDVVHSSPAVSNGIVYCGSFDSKLYALDAKSGNEIWSYQTGTDDKYHLMCGIQSSPSVLDSVVYFGSRDAYIYAVNAFSGKLKWKQKFGGSWMPSSTALSEDKIYVGSSDAKKYFSLDRETGNIIDSINTYSYTFSSPAISGNTVYIGAFNGFLHSIDRNNGSIKWTFKTDASEKFIDKYLTDEGVIKNEFYEGISFKKPRGMQISLNRFFSIGAIVSSPVIDEGTLYFSSADGYLYAIN